MARAGAGRQRARQRTRPADAAPPRTRSIWRTAATALLVIAGVWAYAPSFTGVFLLDDSTAIAWNTSIRTLWPPTAALSPPPSTSVSGRPVANITLAINYALAPADARDVFAPATPRDPADTTVRFVRNVWGYHALNLAIHLAAALTLFGVVRRTLTSPRLRAGFEPASSGLAFAAALVWLVHPLQTQAVTYVVQRVESLMGLFYLLTLYCAIRSADPPPSQRFGGLAGAFGGGGQGRESTRVFTILAIFFCALGMATKEVMVTAPVMVFLWDWTFGQKRRWPLYAGLAATWLVLVPILLSQPRGHTVGFGLNGWTAWTYLLTQASVVTHYLRLTLLPAPLVFSYAWPMTTSLGAVLPQATLLTSLVVVSVMGLVRRHPLGFAGAWFFGILAPTSSVVPIVTEVAAEHRLYLPLAAVVVCIVVGAYAAGRRLFQTHQRAGVITGAAIVAVVVAALGVETRARNVVYQSDEAMWLDTVQKQPNSSRAHAAYGMDLVVTGRYAEAETHLEAAVKLDEASPLAQASLGAAQFGLRKFDDAIPHLERALALWPDYIDAHRNLGEIYAARQQDALAVEHLSRALGTKEPDPRLLVRLARILATSRDDAVRNGARAVELAERAVLLTGAQDPVPLEALAAAYAEADRFGDAITAIQAALARAAGQPAVRELQQRLADYQAHRKVVGSGPYF